MILVDSSVWIDYFNGTVNRESDTLDSILGREPIVIGDLILAEVLQGFRNDLDFRTAKRLLMSFPIHPLVNTESALRSADLFRTLRKKGITIRKTVDTFIAVFCLDNGVPLLTSDREFRAFEKHCGLVLASR
ncbi:MAG: PIN domain nuclease [Candidatus Omnitrophica bacterium]|nr:PIN domain nuclease [Candidatus Omnitrophota bacterium]MCA9431343.1 PIN domain nuclease [Candidatus Omnitrophota bacterium]MCB9766713.1 PIN domain nuclease [Candidatus Omnitrophota bacterium]